MTMSVRGHHSQYLVEKPDTFDSIKCMYHANCFLHAFPPPPTRSPIAPLPQVAWEQLLACRKADLMCLLPLTAQRLADLSSAHQRAAQRRAQLERTGTEALHMLATFAEVNRSSADELEAAGVEALVSGYMGVWVCACAGCARACTCPCACACVCADEGSALSTRSHWHPDSLYPRQHASVRHG